jgi:hypothetical protein
MRVNKLYMPLFMLLLVTFNSCEDVLEEDITNDIVQTIAPINNQVVTSNIVQFSWNSLDGADKYRVQVFSGNVVVRDSLVSQTNLNLPLSPGAYSWRVRGENFAYNSSYSLNSSFVVQLSSDLSSQQVILTSPNDLLYTNNSNLALTWEPLLSASSYSFELVNVTEGNLIVNQQNNLTNTFVNVGSSLISQNAEYRWRVRGVNLSSQTPFSSRRFYIDTVLPNQPTNSLPLNNSLQIAGQPIAFNWVIAADSGVIQSPLIYTIEFSNSSSFTTILQSTDVTVNSFQQSFNTVGDYYWRVKAKDQAGNIGLASGVFKFTVN